MEMALSASPKFIISRQWGQRRPADFLVQLTTSLRTVGAGSESDPAHAASASASAAAITAYMRENLRVEPSEVTRASVTVRARFMNQLDQSAATKWIVHDVP